MTNSKIAGNRLECCQLREFQRWLTDNSTQLDEQSRRSAVCFTPQYQTNAPLVDIKPLECIDNSDDVDDNSFLPYNERNAKENNSNDDSSNIKSLKLVSSHFDTAERHFLMSWSATSMNMSNYGCDKVQVYCIPASNDGRDAPGSTSQQNEVYSKPLTCDNLTSYALINVVREIEQL